MSFNVLILEGFHLTSIPVIFVCNKRILTPTWSLRLLSFVSYRWSELDAVNDLLSLLLFFWCRRAWASSSYLKVPSVFTSLPTGVISSIVFMLVESQSSSLVSGVRSEVKIVKESRNSINTIITITIYCHLFSPKFCVHC